MICWNKSQIIMI